MGWALKTVKKPSRMEARVKAYLVQKFDTCCRTGQKADPVQVARKVKIAKDDAGICCLPHRNGEHMSTVDEEFFLMALSSPATDTNGKRYEWNATNQELTAEDSDLEALENEITLEKLRMAVNLQVTAPQHPIVVRNRNLRELSKAKKLDIPVLKVAELREMCESLRLEVSGSLARKNHSSNP